MLGFSLFIGQAFLYNAVTVTLGLTLTTYLGVGSNKVGLFYAVFAAGNFLGPLLLGRLFDTVGRRPMIAGTYLISAAMLVVVGVGFNGEVFSDWGLTLALAATFFFASAGASSAYLTVSEVFPMEIRALAIAFFYAIGTAIGGITGPLVFQKLGESGDVGQVMIAYFIGAAVMAVGGIVEIFLGVRAEGKPLENIAKPITAREAEEGTEGEADPSARRPRSATAACASAGSASGWAPAPLPARPWQRLVLAVPAARHMSREARSGSTTRSGSSTARSRSTASSAAASSRSESARATGVPGDSGQPCAARSRTARSAAGRRSLRLGAPAGEHRGLTWGSAAHSSVTRCASGPRARRCAGAASAIAALADQRPTRMPRQPGATPGVRSRRRSDLGKRAPLSLTPLRLVRRGR